MPGGPLENAINLHLGILFWDLRGKKRLMAGLGLFDQKSALAVTMPVVTAFKFCIGHRINGLLDR
jgi:hypothetical protein